MQDIPRSGLALIAAASLLWLAGCASSYPRPTEQLSETEAALSSADGANARQAAPVLLNSAQGKLADAREAIDREDYRKATWLLEDAEVEADLAKAKAETAKTQRAVDELQDSIESLQEKLDSQSS